MRRTSRLGLVVLAGFAIAGFGASTPADACAQTCPIGCGQGDYRCEKSGCGYIWPADQVADQP